MINNYDHLLIVNTCYFTDFLKTYYLSLYLINIILYCYIIKASFCLFAIIQCGIKLEFGIN